jgi:hypothetical protein
MSPTLEQFTPSLAYGDALLVTLFSVLLEAIWIYISLNSFKSPHPIAPRLAAATLPILLNLWLPLLFSPATAATTVALLCFNFMWLTNSKLLQWSLNRGPLPDFATHTSLSPSSSSSIFSFLQVAAILLIPITPILSPTIKRVGSKGRLQEEAGNFETLFLFWLLKLALVATVVASLLLYDLPPFIRTCIYSMGLYGLLSAVMDGPAAMVTALLGLKCSPHFDHPWRATSVASFWSKRWDLAAGNTLRQLVYDPIIERKLIGHRAYTTDSSGSRRSTRSSSSVKERSSSPTPATTSMYTQLLGTFASFIISGLVHECIFFYLQSHFTGGCWLIFFSIQPLAMIAERLLLLDLLKQRLGVHVPDVVRIVWSVGFLLVSGHYLFWRVVEESGISERVVWGVQESWNELGGRVVVVGTGG